MMAFGVFSSHIEKPSLGLDKGKDRRGLGSYCSLVTTGKSRKPARIVTYYRPSDKSRHRMPKKGRQTVFTQHIREFKQQGIIDKDPRLEADRCLVADLKRWKTKGEKLILLGDFNQSIYKSALVTQLNGPDQEIKEQFKLLHGKEASYSHIKGKLPIMGCFATSGVEIKAYFISDHHVHGSVDDHRLHVLDFSSQYIIGDNLPRVTKRSGTKLQWKVPWTSRKYTRDLVQVSRANKLDKKARAQMHPSPIKAPTRHHPRRGQQAPSSPHHRLCQR